MLDPAAELFMLISVIVAGVVLAFYWVIWMPALIALSALGMGELFGLAQRASSALGRVPWGVAVAVAVLAVAVPSLAESVRVGGLTPLGAKFVPGIRAGLGLRG